MRIGFTLFLLGFVFITAAAQSNTIAGYEKALANAKDDSTKQFYHSKLFWEYYLQPKKFVYHIVEANMYEGNEWSAKELIYNFQIFIDSSLGIKRELKEALQKHKAAGDKFREACVLSILSSFEEDRTQQIKYIQDAITLIQEQKASRLRDILLTGFKQVLFFVTQNGNDAHLGFTELIKLIDENKQKNCTLNAKFLTGLLGAKYNTINKPDSAKYYSKQCLEYLLKIGARRELYLPIAAQLLLNCGQLNQYDSCKYYSKLCESNLEYISKYKLPSAMVLSTVALYYMNVEASGMELSKEKSKMYLDKAKIAIDNTIPPCNEKVNQLSLYYTYYAEWARLFKEYQIASEMNQKLLLLFDSVKSAQNVKTFSETQVKYDVAQKDKDLSLAHQETQKHIIWFIVLVVVLLLIGLWVFFYQRNRNKIKRLEEMLKVRNTIATNLHDEVGSTLGSVAIMSRIAQSKDQEEKDGMLHTISDNSQNMLDSMRDIVWSINPENDTLEKILSRMKIFAAETLEKQDIDVVFNADIKHLTTVIPIEKRKDFYLIYKEAIINAAKYSKADKVEIKIIEENNTLILSIIDNGIGFKKDATETLGGNGLKNMQKRAESIGGTIDVKTTENNGTFVMLQVKL